MKSAERLKILGLKGISAIVTAVMIAAFAAEPISGGISAKAANTDEPLKISEWGSLSIGGTGYVTGIVTGQEVMYARTDVGGAYRYDNGRWTQIMSFVSADEVGMMSVESIAVDPSGQRFSITGIDTSALDVSQFTLEAVSQPDADVYYYEAVNTREEGNIKFSNIVLTDILDNELNYYYLARPCVTYTISGVQYCEYGNIVSRSVFYVAKVCYDNNLVGEADKSYLLERILNKVDAENYPLPEPDNDYIRPE